MIESSIGWALMGAYRKDTPFKPGEERRGCQVVS